MIEFLSYLGITAISILIIVLAGLLISGFIRRNQETKEELLLFHLVVGLLIYILLMVFFLKSLDVINGTAKEFTKYPIVRFIAKT